MEAREGEGNLESCGVENDDVAAQFDEGEEFEVLSEDGD